MTAGGGGSILVEPAALEALSTKISGVASGTGSARGGLGQAASAAAGCQDPAAYAYTRLQTLLSGAMECLDDASKALASAVSQAANAYAITDTTQMSGGR
jgi:uncharacterized protein YukE